MEVDSFLEELGSFGVGVRDMHDPFFDEGNTVCQVYSRNGIVDEDDESLCHELLKKFPCDVPNCKAEFDNLLTYELHYNSCHRFTCSECKKQFISPHFLDLHLSETHDSFFLAQAERKPMYKCFIQSCEVVSVDAKQRKKHCIEEHQFPHDFKYGCQPLKKTAKKNKQKKGKTKGESMEVTEIQEVDEVEPSTSKPSVTTITSFTFGKKKPSKTFQTHKKDTAIEMKELLDSLPN